MNKRELLQGPFQDLKKKNLERLSSCKKHYMKLMMKCSNVVNKCVIW